MYSSAERVAAFQKVHYCLSREDRSVGVRCCDTSELLSDSRKDLSKEYEVVELEDVTYISIELLRGADSVEFWSQNLAVQELRARV